MMPAYRQHPQLVVLLAVILALAVLAGGLLLVFQVLGAPETTVTPPPASNSAVLEGTYICLPRSDGMKAVECTPGIKTDDGTLYALDLGPLIGMGGDPQLKNGEKIAAGGEMVRIDELSTDQWDSYSVTELMRVEEIARP